MNKEKKLELAKKVEKYGLDDLRKLAPIGDLWYMNGWEKGGLEYAIYNAFWEQKEKFGYELEGHSSGYRMTDHHSYCKELGLRWSVDSGD